MGNEFIKIFTEREIFYLLVVLVLLNFAVGQINKNIEESMINKIRKKWREEKKKHFEEAGRIYPFEESWGYEHGIEVSERQKKHSDRLDEEAVEEIKREYNLTDKGWDGLEAMFLLEEIRQPGYKKKLRMIKKKMKDTPLFMKKQND